ncbi:hypothetical protein B0A52_07158 [Exophiala mesophila]|uniref:Uncharacterized protein n=1 Tax=Exophiala mesophila TaxID=212818 RepID=A0A438N0G5_EXOME|nr:hypothetical protein B0A52_07158 [Exophiala mesophila]
MSQSTPAQPLVIMNAAGNRQQVPLRDYLNARVAPFLKKAITESLGVEAEFPLQWLGECLIHQSILYEGNPDATNIRERFAYKFEDPKPQERQPSPAPAEGEPVQTDPVQNQPESMHSAVEPSSDISRNEAPQADPAPSSSTVPPMPDSGPVPSQAVVNGITNEEAPANTTVSKDDDTEMGGTS